MNKTFDLSSRFAAMLEQQAAFPVPDDFGTDEPADYGEYQKARKRKNKQDQRQRQKKAAQNSIAILDMETDPFDAENLGAVHPFLGVLYSDDFAPIVIWENDYTAFVAAIVAAIEGLPGRYTIYAHNGGKFDYLFLIAKIRGKAMFKGRGLMSFRIGNHDLRDSFHIIPEKLASYHKDHFDYSWMKRSNRDLYRQKIIDYCISDCKYLLEIVKDFVKAHGFKLSIGQAAMAEFRKHYTVERLNDQSDTFLRKFFFGGRVECLAGAGHFEGPFKMYDVNSMYPYAMANYEHPIGNSYESRIGMPRPETCFVEIDCISNGAFVRRMLDGSTGADRTRQTFFTTIHELRIALKYDLIRDVHVARCIDFDKRGSFPNFVNPLYEKRERMKHALKTFDKDDSSLEHMALKRDSLFTKLLLNNAYGKFAQNPRKFQECFITDAGHDPDAAECDPENPWFCHVMAGEFWLWTRPSPRQTFNNVATAASITGAARAVLLEAICCAVEPIYCDTDSLICRELNGHDLHASRLGAWDLETTFSEVLIVGKKMYAGRELSGREKIKSKGVSNLTWQNMLDMLKGDTITKRNFAPTLTRDGGQHYLERRVKITTEKRKPAQ
jgi:hypothetical protein